ncbi:MAG: hypothetical protein PHU42_04045 [Patescibacteria group bacterium]|nr:hypothetical protein [Patescibacteria group bacterium]
MNPDTVSKVISNTAFSVICFAHLMFVWKALRNQTKPNAISWGAWAFAGIINVFSYHAMSGDPVVALWTKALAAMSGLMFICAILKKGSYRFTVSEFALLTLSIMAALILYVFHDARGASLIMVLALAIPFIPVIKGLMKNPENESMFSWIVLDAGYALVLINVFLRWTGEWGNVAVPALCFFGNACVIWLSSEARKKVIHNPKGDDQK